MTEEKMSALAIEMGFSAVAPLDVATLKFLPEVREMCASGRCNMYGRNWCCPPACGELEELKARAGSYSKGILLQVIGDREDSYDFEAIEEIEKRCKKSFYALVDALKTQNVDFFPLSAGTCTRCVECTYPDKPCRFPEVRYPSMEAAGLFVSQICRDNGMPYYYGENKMAFTCCILYNIECAST